MNDILKIVDKGTEGSMVLVDSESKEPVSNGTSRRSINGTLYKIVGGRAPHKLGSTGRVYVKNANGGFREFFPSVLDLEWVPVVSVREA